MSFDYIDSVIPIITLIIGIYLGINTVKFFSSEIVYKLENSFEKELEKYQDYVAKSLNIQISAINKKVEYQDLIVENFKKINDYLSNTSERVLKLSHDLDNKKELESEIIKLKNIIKRMEKRA